MKFSAFLDVAGGRARAPALSFKKGRGKQEDKKLADAAAREGLSGLIRVHAVLLVILRVLADSAAAQPRQLRRSERSVAAVPVRAFLCLNFLWA